jgi:hypothetical protein
MHERYTIAISYLVFWMSLGWGTFGVCALMRWKRRRRAHRNH